MKIKGTSGHVRPRNIRRAQIMKMKKQWPTFEMQQFENGTILWRGRLRGFQKEYVVGILWNVKTLSLPYVYLIEPPLTPRHGMSFADIPHLMYYSKDPHLSGLCLFDPEGGEWSCDRFIADTTLPWAAQWLYFYELWHYDGKWRGGGVGPESIAQAEDPSYSQKDGRTRSHPEERSSHGHQTSHSRYCLLMAAVFVACMEQLS